MTDAQPTTTATLTDGYLLIEDLISPEECDLIGARLLEYARGDRPAGAGISVQREPGLSGDAAVAPGQDVRKISGLHADELIRDQLISRAEVTAPLREILGDRLRLFRADALMKPAQVGSAKGLHQDSPYWPIRPMSLWSCWMPLDDADEENGCMLVVPGSHALGGLPHEHRGDDFVIDDQHLHGAVTVAVPMRRGSGLFFHSLVVHATAANTSGRSRRAITMSYMGDAHADTNAVPRDYPVVG